MRAKLSDIDAATAGLSTTYGRIWQPSTAYTAGDIVRAPDGSTVQRTTSGTSGATYTGANWTVLVAAKVDSDTAYAGRALPQTKHAPALGLYFPEAEGAAGDGTTNDTTAFQAAVDAQRNSTNPNGRVWLTAGKTYLVTMVNINEGTIIEGYGATIKRPASQPNWIRTLTTENRVPTASATDAKRIVLRGFTIDGNLANQGAYSAGQLEQSQLIMLVGNAGGSGRLTSLLEDIIVQNCVSDGVHVLANVYATIRNLRAFDCWRGGVVMSGGNSVVRLDGYIGGGAVTGACIDMEMDAAGYGGSFRCDLTARNVTGLTASPTCKPLQLSGAGGSQVNIDGLTWASGLYLTGGDSTTGHGRIRIRNAVIDVYQATSCNQVVNPADVVFDDCEFRFNNSTGSAITTAKALEVTHNLAGDGSATPRLLVFRNCRFTVGTTVAGDLITAVYVNADTYANVNEVILDGGPVASGYDTAYRLASGGRLSVKNRPRVASTYFLRLSSSNAAGRPYRVSIGQVDFQGTTYLWSETGESANVIEHHDTFLDEAKNAMASVAGFPTNSTAGGRVLMMTAAPTTSTPGLKGDTARLKVPVAGSAYEWVCTTSGVNAGSIVWKASRTLAV